MNAVARVTTPVRPAVGTFFLVTGAVFATWATRVPAVQERLGLSVAGLTVALFGLTAGAVAGLPAAGVIVARWGSRRALLAATGVYLAALPLIGVAPTLPVLTGALALFAFANSTVDVAMNTQGLLIERAVGRPVLGRQHAMLSAGGIAGATVGALAAGAGIGPAAHFAATSAVLAGVCAVAAVALLPDAPARRAGRTRPATPSRLLWLLGLIAFCALLGEGVINDWGAVFLHDAGNAPSEVAAAGFAAFSAGMVVGRLATDPLRSRFPSHRLLAGCALVSATGAALAVAVPVPAAGLVAYALVGLGIAPVAPVAFSRAADDPMTTAGAVATVSAIGYLGFLAGPPLMGALITLTSLHAAMSILIVVTSAMGMLGRTLRNR